MNIGCGVCSLLCVLFLVCALVFALGKEKAAIFISGFNTMPKEKRELYDKEKMSLDFRNSLLIWSGILFIGAVLSYFISQYLAILAVIVWLIVFFRDVHFDAEKAFEKYKK